MKTLLNKGRPLEPLARAKRCAACGTELQVAREFEQVWTMRCPRCTSLAVLGKAEVGGTIGAGDKEALPDRRREV
jgi:DNA-directed RNA polymerase subunit RPC12/RpoP